MSHEEDYRVVLSLIRSREFSDMWARANREAVTRDSYGEMDMPENYSEDELFTIITALRRRFSTEIPFANYIISTSESYNWFSATSSMQESLRFLVSQAQAGSALDIQMSSILDSQSRISMMLDEFLSVCRRDGIDIPYESARAILSGERSPQTPLERLLANFRNLSIDIPRYTGTRISPSLLEELHDRLIDGVAFPIKPEPRPRIKERKPSILDDPDEAIDMICRLANARGCARAIHPIFCSILISGVFWEFYPLPEINAVLELVVRIIHYHQVGLPMLAFASFSQLSESWEQGTLTLLSVPWSYLDLRDIPDCGEGFDATTHFASELKLLEYEIERLHDVVARLKLNDLAMRHRLEENQMLNFRQKDILISALKNRGMRFKIDEHRRLHDIAYATARQDFLSLHEMGFVSLEKQDRVFIFRPTEKFFSWMSQELP
ncbi:MAG: hypothetical protein LBI64_03350 [Coriobacteriales bacterium]|nr:hypothetical protein [Coriobacteriales bacterium]